MTLTRVKLDRFTAFRKLDLKLSPGINVFIGANATGKTHLLKVLYAACDVTRTGDSLPDKLVRVFLPNGRRPGRLVHRQKGSTEAMLAVFGAKRPIRVRFSNHATTTMDVAISGAKGWMKSRIECAYIPAKEILSNAPGFRSLYAARDIQFEAVYADIIDRAYRPILRGPTDKDRERLLRIVRRVMEGRVVVKKEQEEFFVRGQQGLIEFPLLAEGMRKLGLLWLLIQNGTLLGGSVFFWDEPETNLSPSVMGDVVQVLLELQRGGVQVFLATHSYVLLKEFDLRRKQSDKTRFQALYRDEASGDLECKSTSNYLDIHPNAIAETFANLYDRDVRRALGSDKKA